MAYTLGLPDGYRAGLASTTTVAFFAIDDDARAAAQAALLPGVTMVVAGPGLYPIGNGSSLVSPPARVFLYAVDQAFAYFGHNDAGGFVPFAANGNPLMDPTVTTPKGASQSSDGAKPRLPIRLIRAPLSRSFVGGQVLYDVDGNNKWKLATVVSDGTLVMGAGGAPIPAATVAAQLVEVSKSGVARSRSLQVLYTAADGGLYLGDVGTSPVAATAPPVTAAAIALLPRDGRYVAFQGSSGWSVSQWT